MSFGVLKGSYYLHKTVSLYSYYHKALEIPHPAGSVAVSELMTLLFLFTFISIQLRIRRFLLFPPDQPDVHLFFRREE